MTQEENLYAIAGAGGGGCFRKGTPVQLQHGKTIPIEQLKVGDEILSFDEKGDIHLAKVTKVHYHADPQPILRVKYWNGVVELTPNHWVLNQYGAFSEAGRMTIHDCFVDGMGLLRPIIDAELIGHEPVYNLTVEPHHTFIAGGIRVHNGGHRDTYPTIAGAGGGGGSKSSSRVAVEDPDSLQSRSMLSVIDLLGEGQIGGLVDGARSIFFNDTPMYNSDGTANFQGVSWDFRDGRHGQQPLGANFGAVETPVPLSVQVKKDMPAIFTVSNPNADAVRIAIAVQALMRQDKKTGDIHGTSVQFRVEMSLNSGAFQDMTGTLTISGKTRSRYQRAYRLALPRTTTGGQKVTLWTMRVVRITADSTSSALNNDLFVDSYSEIVSSRLTYPMSAYVGITIDSAQFNSIPTRSYLVDGIYVRVPNNYDAGSNTYKGVWDGGFKMAVSSNPAWILYDILTAKRYGLGQYISEDMIDEAKLYQIGKYCDELVPDGNGGWEPRFRINTAIQSRVEAYRVVTDIASVFNGMAYWNGNMVSFTQDAPSDPTMVFTPANVVDGMFNYTGSSRKDRHSVINVSWNDPLQNYKQVVEYVEDAELIQKFGVRKADTVAFGCTTRGQANRVGRWILYTESYQSEMISFEVGIDTATVMPGDVVLIHDTQKAGKRVGGRLKSCTATSATLDFPVDVQANSTISIRLPDGKFAERTLFGAGMQSTVSWGTPLPAMPVANAIWLISSSSLEPIQARVVALSQSQTPGNIGVTCLSHNPSKYDAIEKGLKLEQMNTSLLDYKTVATPTNLVVAESPYEVAPGLLGLTLDVSWTGSATTYEVRWRRTGTYQTNWAVETTSTPSIRLENILAGAYTFEVVGVNSFGARSPKASIVYTPVGRTAAPGDVPNFKVTKRSTDLQLTWSPVMDIDLLGYEIRVGDSWDAGEVVITNYAGTMLAHDQDEAGLYKYHIRSVSRAGSYSDNVSTAEINLQAPKPVIGYELVRHGNGARLELVWEPNRETDLVHYEIREGRDWATSAVLAQVKSTSFTTPAGILGNRIFWIKAVTAPGIYAQDAVWVSTEVAAPNTTNVILTSDQRMLDWPGYWINMEQNGADLIMAEGSNRAEYAFTIDLLDSYISQNSFHATIGAVAINLTDWEAAKFQWREDEAKRSWIIQGDVESITSRKQMARYVGTLSVGEYDGWRLDGSLKSVTGRMPSSSAGVTYDTVRYGTGVVLKSGTKVEWNTPNFPKTFAYQVWLRPKMSGDGITQSILELGTANSSEYLRLAYNGVTRCFEFYDHTGSNSVQAYMGEKGLGIDDLVSVSISQSDNERRVSASVVGKGSGTGALPIPPIGSITKLRLHWTQA